MIKSLRQAAPRWKRLGAAALICVAISSCSSVERDPVAMLEDSLVAISVAADERGLVLAEGTGKVLFLNSKVSEWQSFETLGIGEAPIVFRDNFLYFVDRKNDYRLGNTLDQWERLESEIGASAIIPVGGQGSFLSIFNSGFADNGDGYVFRVLSHTENESNETVYDQFLTGFADCGDSSFAIYDPSISSTEIDNNYFNSPKSLIQLWPENNSSPVISYVPERFLETGGDPNLPCADGVAYQILDSYPDDSTMADTENLQNVSGSVLLAWNTSQKSVKVTELHGALEVDRVKEGQPDPFFVGNRLIGRELWWIAGNGVVLTTNVDTGLTATRFALENFDVGIDPGIFKFSDNFLMRLNLSNSLSSTIEVYSLSDAAFTGDVELPQLGTQLGDRQFIYDFAVTDEEAVVAKARG